MDEHKLREEISIAVKNTKEKIRPLFEVIWTKECFEAGIANDEAEELLEEVDVHVSDSNLFCKLREIRLRIQLQHFLIGGLSEEAKIAVMSAKGRYGTVSPGALKRAVDELVELDLAQNNMHRFRPRGMHAFTLTVKGNILQKMLKERYEVEKVLRPKP